MINMNGFNLADDALGIAGVFGGKFRHRQDVPFTKFFPNTPLPVVVQNYPSTYNQNINGKYYDPYTNYTIIVPYGSSSSTVQIYNEKLNYVRSITVNTESLGMGSINHVILHNGTVNCFMSSGGILRIDYDSREIISTIPKTVTTFSKRYWRRPQKNLVVYFNRVDKRVDSYDLDSGSVSSVFDAPAGYTGFPASDEDGNWYFRTGTSGVGITKYDAQGTLLWQTSSNGFSGSLLNSDDTLWDHRASGYMIGVLLKSPNSEMIRWRKDNGARVSSSSLGDWSGSLKFMRIDNRSNWLLLSTGPGVRLWHLSPNGTIEFVTFTSGINFANYLHDSNYDFTDGRLLSFDSNTNCYMLHLGYIKLQ